MGKVLDLKKQKLVVCALLLMMISGVPDLASADASCVQPPAVGGPVPWDCSFPLCPAGAGAVNFTSGLFEKTAQDPQPVRVSSGSVCLSTDANSTTGNSPGAPCIVYEVLQQGAEGSAAAGAGMLLLGLARDASGTQDPDYGFDVSSEAIHLLLQGEEEPAPAAAPQSSRPERLALCLDQGVVEFRMDGVLIRSAEHAAPAPKLFAIAALSAPGATVRGRFATKEEARRLPPSLAPTAAPTGAPTTGSPTTAPTELPTPAPTLAPCAPLQASAKNGLDGMRIEESCAALRPGEKCLVSCPEGELGSAEYECPDPKDLYTPAPPELPKGQPPQCREDPRKVPCPEHQRGGPHDELNVRLGPDAQADVLTLTSITDNNLVQQCAQWCAPHLGISAGYLSMPMTKEIVDGMIATPEEDAATPTGSTVVMHDPGLTQECALLSVTLRELLEAIAEFQSAVQLYKRTILQYAVLTEGRLLKEIEERVRGFEREAIATRSTREAALTFLHQEYTRILDSSVTNPGKARFFQDSVAGVRRASDRLSAAMNAWDEASPSLDHCDRLLLGLTKDREYLLDQGSTMGKECLSQPNHNRVMCICGVSPLAVLSEGPEALRVRGEPSSFLQAPSPSSGGGGTRRLRDAEESLFNLRAEASRLTRSLAEESDRKISSELRLGEDFLAKFNEAYADSNRKLCERFPLYVQGLGQRRRLRGPQQEQLASPPPLEATAVGTAGARAVPPRLLALHEDLQGRLEAGCEYKSLGEYGLEASGASELAADLRVLPGPLANVSTVPERCQTIDECNAGLGEVSKEFCGRGNLRLQAGYPSIGATLEEANGICLAPEILVHDPGLEAECAKGEQLLRNLEYYTANFVAGAEEMTYAQARMQATYLNLTAEHVQFLQKDGRAFAHLTDPDKKPAALRALVRRLVEGPNFRAASEELKAAMRRMRGGGKLLKKMVDATLPKLENYTSPSFCNRFFLGTGPEREYLLDHGSVSGTQCFPHEKTRRVSACCGYNPVARYGGLLSIEEVGVVGLPVQDGLDEVAVISFPDAGAALGQGGSSSIPGQRAVLEASKELERRRLSPASGACATRGARAASGGLLWDSVSALSYYKSGPRVAAYREEIKEMGQLSFMKRMERRWESEYQLSYHRGGNRHRIPTPAPTAVPTQAPTAVPTQAPTLAPTAAPTFAWPVCISRSAWGDDGPAQDWYKNCQRIRLKGGAVSEDGDPDPAAPSSSEAGEGGGCLGHYGGCAWIDCHTHTGTTSSLSRSGSSSGRTGGDECGAGQSCVVASEEVKKNYYMQRLNANTRGEEEPSGAFPSSANEMAAALNIGSCEALPTPAPTAAPTPTTPAPTTTRAPTPAPHPREQQHALPTMAPTTTPTSLRGSTAATGTEREEEENKVVPKPTLLPQEDSDSYSASVPLVGLISSSASSAASVVVSLIIGLAAPLLQHDRIGVLF